MSISAMKQALEALEHEAKMGNDNAYKQEREALRAAIEQAELVQRAEEAFDRSEQYVMKNAHGEFERISLVQTNVGIGIQAEQAKPMGWMMRSGHGTHYQESVSPEMQALTFGGKPMWTPLYTAPSPRQSLTIAWMYDFLNPDKRDEVIRNWVTQDLSEIDGAKGFNVRPLYTAPPQRQPLTDEEIDELSRMMVKSNKSVNWLCRAIEAKIREKNNMT